jgi:hypothetical protein
VVAPIDISLAGEGEMKSTYEYGRIRQLAQTLADAGVSKDIIAEIMAGGEAIGKSAKPEAKAAWLSEAMRRMDRLLKPAVRHSVRESCACCLGGKRLELSKAIARDHESLEDRIGAANATRFVFGHSVSLTDTGEVLVAFAPEGQDHYRCACLPKAAEPISITYCYCCGGHVKHHLQTALGRNLQMKVTSSALASSGKEPCTFKFRIMD